MTRGDRMHDPNWVAINVNKDRCLPAPVDKIAGLTRIDISGALLKPAFTPNVKTYTATLAAGAGPIEVLIETTSTRSRSLTIDGEAVKPGTPHQIRRTGRGQKTQIQVTSPDGTQTAEYVVNIQ